MGRYIVLVQQNPDYAGPDSWYRKGGVQDAEGYEADSAADAVRVAYANSYLARQRGGAPQSRFRVAVTGPGHVWEEFDVVLEPQPAKIVSVEPA